jgi:GntR family transcriptional regulator
VQERPAYLLVADELRRRIQSGRYPPGSKLPTFDELQRAYGVSEIVIRNAVSLLRHEGLVDTRRGGGTVVRRRPQVRRLGMDRYRTEGNPAAGNSDANLGGNVRPNAGPNVGAVNSDAGQATSFTADHGIPWHEYRLSARFSTVRADKELAAVFGVGAGTPLLRRHFVFYARQQPEQISVNFLPLDLVMGTPVADPAREPWPGGTPAQLASLGHPVTRVEESVTARMPTAAEAQTLRMSHGTPVFAIFRLMISGDAVLEVCRHIVIPADRVVLDYRIDLAGPPGPGG